jgi:integrase
MKNGQEPKRHFFSSEDERDAIMAFCRTTKYARLWPIFQLMVYTGLRPIEAGRLEWQDVELKPRGEIRVWHRKGRGQKRWRAIPLHAKAVEAIEELARRVPQRVGKVVRTAAGLPYEMGPDGSRTPTFAAEWARMLKHFVTQSGGRYGRCYDLRHTFASLLRKKGRQLDEVGQLLGHSNLNVTQRYAHIGSDELRSAIDAL